MITSQFIVTKTLYTTAPPRSIIIRLWKYLSTEVSTYIFRKLIQLYLNNIGYRTEEANIATTSSRQRNLQHLMLISKFFVLNVLLVAVDIGTDIKTGLSSSSI